MSEERAAKMGFERAGELEQVKLGDCLWDMHAAGMKILEFTGGRDFNEFSESEVLQSVVVSMLGIMAERLTQMERQFPTEYARIAQGPSLIGPPTANPEKLWRVVEEVVPEAVDQVRLVLEDWHEA